ncbi:hypothetical protein SAMN04488574_104273 [Bacillus sp. 71mf]|uniref:hypothetical protein n=1 Tax=Bacillus sp. 103mf TaxID=1761751 RepID=UPI0008F21632|nr:hypothetical protein [Bacillus sp. 103mf]SFI79527.1 hypothetical protein SAMN04488574_104273 [Bacillus sp. 71mf]SFS85777.1 hypothetical protein SAMN04488145_10493 [Bacillus sp. 103mf]
MFHLFITTSLFFYISAALLVSRNNLLAGILALFGVGTTLFTLFTYKRKKHKKKDSCFNVGDLFGECCECSLDSCDGDCNG